MLLPAGPAGRRTGRFSSLQFDVPGDDAAKACSYTHPARACDVAFLHSMARRRAQDNSGRVCLAVRMPSSGTRTAPFSFGSAQKPRNPEPQVPNSIHAEISWHCNGCSRDLNSQELSTACHRDASSLFVDKTLDPVFIGYTSTCFGGIMSLLHFSRLMLTGVASPKCRNASLA